jgi:hypothetical protein
VSRPEFLKPVTTLNLREAVVGKLPLYCGACYKQVTYRGIVQVLPTQYASATTEHHEFRCPRCRAEARFEKSEVGGAGYADWSWFMPSHYDDSLLRFAPPEDTRSRFVDITDGRVRYTSLKTLTAEESAEQFAKKLAELQR